MLPTEHDLSDSPCCGAAFLLLPLGNMELFHYACRECHKLYVWDGHRWTPCQNPEKHIELSHAGALSDSARADARATGKEGG
jgi:hypothetical protein